MSTKSEIIAKFHLFMDDTSELSSQEESDLFDKVYQEVCSDRPWEFTKKEYTGTQSTSVEYVDLPTDFGFLTENQNYSDDINYSSGPCVFVGSSYEPYPVVSWSDRRQYRNKGGYAYVDIVNSRLYFTAQPTTAEAIEYDYHAVMPDLELDESPAFPARFHDVLYHAMCVDDFIIQQSDKAKSYAAENKKRKEDYLNGMSYWNANLIQMN